MTSRTLERAEMFSHFTEKPILFIKDLFGDGTDYWFVAYDFTPANPSNHIHQNTLRSGICINIMMSNVTDFDEIMFLTKLSEFKKSSITFGESHKWLLIK